VQGITKLGQHPYVKGITTESAVPIAEVYTERAKQRMVRSTSNSVA
jgi:hypothetical protein